MNFLEETLTLITLSDYSKKVIIEATYKLYNLYSETEVLKPKQSWCKIIMILAMLFWSTSFIWYEYFQILAHTHIYI